MHAHTPDFTQEALYLSEQLDISENNCAILLQHGMSRKSRYGRANADSAVIMYYQERSAVLRCLKLIFQTGDSEEMIQSGMSEELEKFRTSLVESSVKIKGQASTWIDKLFTEVNTSKQEIQKLKTQLTLGTPSASNQPSQTSAGFGLGSSLNASNQGPPSSNILVVKFSDEIVQKMLEQHQSERRELGQIIYLIGFARLFQPTQILSLIDTLTAMDSQDPLIYHYLSTFLAAMDGECTSETTDAEYEYLSKMWNDTTFLRKLNEHLTTKRWLIKQAKAVALLQWCLFLGSAYQSVMSFPPPS